MLSFRAALWWCRCQLSLSPHHVLRCFCAALCCNKTLQLLIMFRLAGRGLQAPQPNVLQYVDLCYKTALEHLWAEVQKFKTLVSSPIWNSVALRSLDFFMGFWWCSCGLLNMTSKCMAVHLQGPHENCFLWHHSSCAISNRPQKQLMQLQTLMGTQNVYCMSSEPPRCALSLLLGIFDVHIKTAVFEFHLTGWSPDAKFSIFWQYSCSHKIWYFALRQQYIFESHFL